MATSYDVVAAFPDKRRAQRAVERLTQAGVKKSNVHVLRPGMDHHPAQAKRAVNGLFVGTLLGGLAGLVVGVLWALFGDGAFGATGRALIAFVPLVVVGAVAGAIVGGAMKPRDEASVGELDEPVLAVERNTIVAVHVSDPNVAEEARHVLEGFGAERIDAITADGTPLPSPRSDQRKPREPSRGWWPGDAGG